MDKRTTEKLKDAARVGSDIHTFWTTIAQPFLFGHGSGSDANPKSDGIQADKKGRTRTDESLFREAFAIAKEELVKEGRIADYTAANMAGKVVTDKLSALPVEVRKDIILDIGLGEQSITEFIPQGKDSKGKQLPDKKVVRNINRRGINICKDLILMTPGQIDSWISSTVNGDEYLHARLEQITEHAKKYVATMEKKHGKLERKSLEELRAENGTNPFSTLYKSLSWRKK